jgi:hypothetical protein
MSIFKIQLRLKIIQIEFFKISPFIDPLKPPPPPLLAPRPPGPGRLPPGKARLKGAINPIPRLQTSSHIKTQLYKLLKRAGKQEEKNHDIRKKKRKKSSSEKNQPEEYRQRLKRSIFRFRGEKTVSKESEKGRENALAKLHKLQLYYDRANHCNQFARRLNARNTV